MVLMSLNHATLNAKGQMDSSKCARLLGELLSLIWHVAGVQETHLICPADCWVLKDDYVVLSAYGSRSSVGVSLIIGRIIKADLNLVLVDDRGRMVVADVAIKNF